MASRQAPVVVDVSGLPSKSETGYRQGRPFPLRLLRVQELPSEQWLSEPAAASFLAMRAAARADGHDLVLGFGFRNYATQARLRAERHNPDGSKTEAGRRLGGANRPGFSLHQSGVAADIDVDDEGDATERAMAPRRQSRRYRWIAANAARFGWRRTVPDEPWHWEFSSPSGEALAVATDGGAIVAVLFAVAGVLAFVLARRA